MHTRRTTATASALLALALTLGAAGCGSETSDSSDRKTAAETSPATSPQAPDTSTTTEPTTSPSTATSKPKGPPFSKRASDGGQGSGNGLGVTDVRAAKHAGYDRVVFDLGGTGDPGWRVSYVTDPVQEGSGEPVALKGTTFLQVDLRGLGMPFDTGLEPFGDSNTRISGDGTSGIAEIAPGGVFEGIQGAYIGLDGAKRPFRAFALKNPTRLVVDVRASR